MSRAHPLSLSFSLLICVTVSLITAQTATSKSSADRSPVSSTLQVDPRLIAEAHEAWSLIGSQQNPIWPGWDASSTPLLFYLPGEQDVLINHPHPPQGFLRYEGPVRFPGWEIWVKNGPTRFAIDGQNTSTEVNGVPTLAVADTLSNLRNQVATMVADTKPADQKLQAFHALDLATDPYDQIATVVHEAFHVFQDKQAPDKGADEMSLTTRFSRYKTMLALLWKARRSRRRCERRMTPSFATPRCAGWRYARIVGRAFRLKQWNTRMELNSVRGWRRIRNTVCTRC